MNRLDDVDWWAEQCQFLSCDRGYYSGTVRQLVAVARAAAEFEDALAAERRDPYNLELVHRTCIARNVVRMALAPLLTNKDGASHGMYS